jgi:hypothetical protein
MALGLIFGRDDGEAPPDAAYEKAQMLLKRFKDTYGSCNCLELTGCDLSSEEGRKQFAEKGMREKCLDFTKSAVSMAAEIADVDGKTSDGTRRPD